MGEAAPLLIDCDPGIDDAVALALAAVSPEVELLAVTTVSGNVPVDLTTRNARAILHLLGRGEVPVAPGSARALIRTPPPYPPIHGENGLGGVELPDGADPADEDAIALMARVLTERPAGTVTIAALGPLTNIALLAARHPDAFARAAALYTMSGSIDYGNITPVAEFNVWVDPEAAHRVLNHPPIPVRMIGLNVTRQAAIDRAELEQLRTRSERGDAFARMVDGYADFSGGEWPLHDVAIVGAIVDPDLCGFTSARIEVDTGLGVSRAQTVCELLGRPAFLSLPEASDGHERAEVAIHLDRERFRKLFLGRVD